MCFWARTINLSALWVTVRCTKFGNKEALENLEVNGEQVDVDYVRRCKNDPIIKLFSKTSKDIRTSRWPNHFYVTFENPETMRPIKQH